MTAGPALRWDAEPILDCRIREQMTWLLAVARNFGVVCYTAADDRTVGGFLLQGVCVYFYTS